MAKKLRALARYECGPRGLSFAPGQEFAADDALYLFLMADAPGCFEAVDETPVTAAVEQPAADKMVKRPKASK